MSDQQIGGERDGQDDGEDAPQAESGWVNVGRLGRAHGVQGELRLELFNPDSEVLDLVESLRVTVGGRAPRDLALINARPGSKWLLARFKGVDNREDASRLTGAMLSVPRAVLPAPNEDEYYHCDVVGAQVFDEASGERVGLVRQIEVTSCDVLDIRLDAGGSVMVPVTRAYVVSIGETPGRVVVRDLDHWRE